MSWNAPVAGVLFAIFAWSGTCNEAASKSRIGVNAELEFAGSCQAYTDWVRLKYLQNISGSSTEVRLSSRKMLDIV